MSVLALATSGLAPVLGQSDSEDVAWDVTLGLALVATAAVGAVILTVLVVVRNRRDRRDGRGGGEGGATGSDHPRS